MEGAAADDQVVTSSFSMRKKAEIDTSAPFRSVQEAVRLFGERIITGQIYACNKLKEMENGTAASTDRSRLGRSITAELEDTKQSLQKAREEGLVMATCLSSLQEELQKTKKELQNLRDQHRQQQQQQERADQPLSSSLSSQKHVLDCLEIEDVKFVEESWTEDEESVFQVDKTETVCCSGNKVVEFQKKRYLTFADPPATSTLEKVVPPSAAAATPGDPYVLQRHPSLRKGKKKALIPLIKDIFRKRGNNSAGVGPAGA